MRGLKRLAAGILSVASAFAWTGSPAFADGADACADYPASGFARPVGDALPVHPWTSRAGIAAFIMPFALMSEDADDRHEDAILPYGYYLGPDSRELLTGSDAFHAAITGFYGTTFVHCRSRAVVVVIGSLTNFDPRDYVAGLIRQFGMETTLAATFFDRVAERYPGHDLMVTGHSSGGALASYAAGVRNAPSVVFNPILIDSALVNSGERQLVVRVTGDIYSDPAMAPADGPVLRMIQTFFDSPVDIGGQLFRIEPTQDYRPIWKLHWISVIIDELRLIIG